ncbi:TonB-dependent receptor [Chitinophaga horti]|uniref:TonB-dependent receptor n=1 Tax=Chitinophaga horti TaxID=2920382 RepID=A0ABY6IUU7_9BACT|nr:TonB-dependent receptor [Chitinophaga horti]UYQ91143.1 TonB-dependent receptor [Chitinophaga horti]
MIKLTAFLLFVACLHVSATGLSQQVTLSVRNAPLQKLFKEITARTGVSVIYGEAVLRNTSAVTLSVKNAPLREVLDLCMRNQPLTYTFEGNSIIIKRRAAEDLPPPKLVADTSIIVSGRVTDAKGDAIPGATVMVKGTKNGTQTDAGGQFRLTGVRTGAMLHITSIGFEAQELAARSGTITVALSTSSSSLNETVVVGYGTVKKNDLTGSVARVGESAIKATPIPSLDRAMQGRAAGVQVVTNSARPGGAATIRIRGSGSVNAGNDPLYVVDGFPISGGLNSINSDDVESIEILKDASATAIYGSRGSNGVVMVTTKQGKPGKAIVSYNGYYGSQSVRRTIPLLNARQFATFVNEALVNNGSAPYFNGSSEERALPETFGKGTDWQDIVLQEAPIQNHQLGISGGSEKNRYAISAGYYDQEGIIKNSGFKRYTLRANLTNEITSRVKTGLSMQGAYTKSDNARTDVDGNEGGGVTSAALSYSPTFPVFNPDGSYYKNQGSLNGYAVDNPLAITNEIINKQSLIRILANAYIDYEIIDGLHFRTSLGTDLQAGKTNAYTTRKALAGATLGGSAVVSSSQSINWLNENTLNYTRTFNDIHNFSALLGYTIQGIDAENVTARANTFSDDFAQYHNLGAGSTLVAPSSGASNWKLISYLARVNYGFDDRLLLTLTARRDGSSRFGPSRKFGVFPSGALAWKLMNEAFMQKQTIFSDAKVRVSYGLSGNQEIGDYQYLANITMSPYVLGGTLQSAASTAGIANPDLRWEKNKQFDAGVDLGFLKNRLHITADYYNKITSDLLFSVSVPTSSGFTNTLKNIGSVRNRGVELSIGGTVIDKNDFRWSSDFNITFNRNKILRLDGREEFTTGTDARIFNTFPNPILLKVGSPLGNFYGLVMEGIFQSKEEVDASAQKTAKPGDIRYRDRTGDGVINDKDREIIGNSNPDFFGGFNNTFSYKGFELNVFVQGNYGNEILNFGSFDLLNLTGGNNLSARVLERWTPTNPSTTMPRANAGGGSRIISNFQVEDGSYLRFKNISLGYNFSASWLNKLHIQSLKVYIAAQNLFTITNYHGYDPEVNRFGSSSLSQGLDYGTYPAAKTVLAGVNLKF